MTLPLYPDQIPGTPESDDLKLATRMHGWSFIDQDDHSRYWCDENEEEYMDALFGVV